MEEQQPQEQQMMYPSSGGYPMVDSKADLLEKIDPGKAVLIIKNVLMGLSFDENTNKWIPNNSLLQFSLTEFGATIVAGLMYPASSQNSSLSNLKEERIHKRIVGIQKALVKDMLDYHSEMGIKSVAHLFHIASIVYTHIWVSLTQSENEGIRRLLNSTISESRNVSTYGEEKKGGILGLIRR